MADLRILDQKISSYKKSLKIISFDKRNNEYMCNDDENFYCSFDDLVKAEYPLKQPASPDTLMFKNETIYMVEFKNQKPCDIDKKNIHDKLEKGKEVLSELCAQCNIPIAYHKIVFCVIHKNDKSKWRQGIEKKTIQFGLEKYKGHLFDDILTNDIDWFKKTIP
jgi:hypothetical protein